MDRKKFYFKNSDTAKEFQQAVLRAVPSAKTSCSGSSVSVEIATYSDFDRAYDLARYYGFTKEESL